MTKALVNPKTKRVRGSKKFKESPDPAKPILLVNEANGILLGICPDPDLKKTPQDKEIIILDDGVKIATLSKNMIIQAYAVATEPDVLIGVTYTVPLFEHSVMLDYKFQNRIESQGDITKLNFYFKK